MRNLNQLFSREIFRFLLFAILLTAGLPLFAEVIYIEDRGFVIDLPVGWEIMDITDSRYTFNDFTGDGFFQIKVYPGDKYKSAEDMFDLVGQDIAASGEGDLFDLYGREAVFAFIDFASGDYDYSGYGLFADGEDFDLTILSFASAGREEVLADYLLSALDSFSLSPGLMLNPGPVSRYYLESYETPQRVDASTVIEGQPLEWQIDNHAIEASQLVIEREAAVLSDYKPQTEAGVEAWKRYYRMVYRDTYSRLDYPAALIYEYLKPEPGQTLAAEERDKKTAERLLSWVQGFDYRRTGGSDLISPFSAAAFQEGDCDSRSLLYIILLNHYGIDSALMVSSVYSHAMAAVDIQAGGAKININDRGFTVAETTDDVGIGMIAADMADPANWIIIPLMEKEPWN